MQGHAGIAAGQDLAVATQVVGGERKVLPGRDEALGIGDLRGAEGGVFTGLDAAAGVVEGIGGGDGQAGRG